MGQTLMVRWLQFIETAEMATSSYVRRISNQIMKFTLPLLQEGDFSTCQFIEAMDGPISS